MTKMYSVTIETSGVDSAEGKEWANELANIYADMAVSDVNVSGSKISFKAGLSGMDDTEPEDIKMKVEEYATMHEAFTIKKLDIR